MKPPDKYLCKHTEYQEFYDVLPKVQTTFFRTGRKKSNGCFIIVSLEDLYNYFLWAKVSQEDLGPWKVCVKIEIGAGGGGNNPGFLISTTTSKIFLSDLLAE